MEINRETHSQTLGRAQECYWIKEGRIVGARMYKDSTRKFTKINEIQTPSFPRDWYDNQWASRDFTYVLCIYVMVVQLGCVGQLTVWAKSFSDALPALRNVFTHRVYFYCDCRAMFGWYPWEGLPSSERKKRSKYATRTFRRRWRETCGQDAIYERINLKEN